MKKIFSIFCILLGLSIGCTFDKTTTGCELYTARTYTADIKPVMDKYCVSCHGATNPKLETSAQVSEVYDRVLCTMTESGCKLMPQGGPKVHDSVITKLKDWKCNSFK
jgi:hypothetical protein